MDMFSHFSRQLANGETVNDKQQVLLTLLISFLVTEIHCWICAHWHSQSRDSLTCPLLLFDPRVNMLWQWLLVSWADRSYITTMRFDVATFNYILDSGFQDQWDSMSIWCVNVKPGVLPCPGRQSLDAEGGLGLVHYLSSTMKEMSLQEIFTLIPSTVVWYINFALTILLDILDTLWCFPEAAISWPTGQRFSIRESVMICQGLILIYMT